MKGADVSEDGVIKSGSRVVLHYRLALVDGTVVDSTEGEEPLAFSLGDGTFAPALEDVLLGMRAGEKRHVHLEPEQAFGFPDTGNVHDMPKDEFPDDLPIEPGLIISFELPSGEEIPGTILAVTEESARVDFNHPLAGHSLDFEIEVVSLR